MFPDYIFFSFGTCTSSWNSAYGTVCVCVCKIEQYFKSWQTTPGFRITALSTVVPLAALETLAGTVTD